MLYSEGDGGDNGYDYYLDVEKIDDKFRHWIRKSICVDNKWWCSVEEYCVDGVYVGHL